MVIKQKREMWHAADFIILMKYAKQPERDSRKCRLAWLMGVAGSQLQTKGGDLRGGLVITRRHL